MSFHMPIGHLYVFSGEMTRSSVHFFDWVALLLSLLLSCLFFFIVELYELFIYFGD